MDLHETCRAIQTMELRGAGAIGVAAARAVADHVAKAAEPRQAAEEAARLLRATRPTAVTLANAVDHVLAAMAGADDPVQAAQAAATHWQRACKASRQQMIAAALPLLHGHLFTHCHSSTVVDAVTAAHDAGHDVHVTCTETRPFDQGHITAAALARAGVPVTLVVDSMAYAVLQEGIDRVVVGADAVTAEGILVNKVGTAQVALMADHFDTPLHSLATTDKLSGRPAAEIPIEERLGSEVWDGPPAGVAIRNPVFDRTPAALVSSFVMEHGQVAPDEVHRLRPFQDR